MMVEVWESSLKEALSITELAEHGLVVDSRYGPRSMQLKASLSMIDGKMRGLVTG